MPQNKKKQAILSLGSNLGNREESLLNAAKVLDRLPGTSVLVRSSVIKTEPLEVAEEQPHYLNMCVLLETEMSPETLLGCCFGIEAALGRERPYEKAPRTIDIDLLLYQGETRSTPELMLPHPQVETRPFVRVLIGEIISRSEESGTLLR